MVFLRTGSVDSTSSVRLGALPAFGGLGLFVNFEAAHPFDPRRSAGAVEFVQPCVHAGRFAPDHALQLGVRHPEEQKLPDFALADSKLARHLKQTYAPAFARCDYGSQPYTKKREIGWG